MVHHGYSDAWSLKGEKWEIQLFFTKHQLAQMGRYHPNRGVRSDDIDLATGSELEEDLDSGVRFFRESCQSSGI